MTGPRNKEAQVKDSGCKELNRDARIRKKSYKKKAAEDSLASSSSSLDRYPSNNQRIRNKSSSRKVEQNASLNSSSNLDESPQNETPQGAKGKAASKKLKVKRKLTSKKKIDGISQYVACGIGDIDNAVVVLSDVESKSNTEKQNSETSADFSEGQEINVSVKVEIEELAFSSPGESKLLQSTPNPDCSHLTLRMEKHNLLDDENHDNTMGNDNISLNVSINNPKQNISSDQKKRKVIKGLNIERTTLINESYYDVLDESTDDIDKLSFSQKRESLSQKRKRGRKKKDKKAVSLLPHAPMDCDDGKEVMSDNVGTVSQGIGDSTSNIDEDSDLTLAEDSQKQSKDRRYRKKNKCNQCEVVSDNVATTSGGIRHFESNIEDGIGVDDKEIKSPDVTLPEDIRYIHIDLHGDYHGILLLSSQQVVAMQGFMQLAVVHGEVDMSGFKMVADGIELSYVDVFSVTTSSLFYIKDRSPPHSEKSKEKIITHLAAIFQSNEEVIADKLGDIQHISACVIVKKMNSLLPPLLKKLNHFKGFPRLPEFLAQPFRSAVLQTDHWEELLNQIGIVMTEKKDDCTCSLMMCGAGNVGKSSLVRYSINKMLEKHSSVFCLDCDCGQTEFTPPSVLSLVKVTKPLLGLPFSHQLIPVRSFFYGHISPGNTPSEYIKLIRFLFNTYYVDYYSEGPLIINTQGWMQGLGLSLLADCIRMTSPCHIIHINGPNEKNNVPSYLNEEFLEKEEGWDVTSADKCIKNGHGCTYHNLSTTDVQKSCKAGNKSRVSREQCITSYFSSLYQPYFDHALRSGVKCNEWIPSPMSVIMPYIVRWEDVALHSMHEKVTPDVMLFSFNLALVGLARVDPELVAASEPDSEVPNYLMDQPVAEYIGFGIVRNIDPAKKLFYILTPEPVERLKNVNALLRGSAQLPTTYFLEDIHSNQPYFCSDYINVASKTAGGMKPRYNLKRKPSKMRTANIE